MPVKKIRDWVSVEVEMPEDFELCKLLKKDDKIKCGWRSANRWDGFRIEEKEEFIARKRFDN